ncbi:MAG: hypothetical protein R2932_25915 [Caldilineaceae bacterium]
MDSWPKSSVPTDQVHSAALRDEVATWLSPVNLETSEVKARTSFGCQLPSAEAGPTRSMSWR